MYGAALVLYVQQKSWNGSHELWFKKRGKDIINYIMLMMKNIFVHVEEYTQFIWHFCIQQRIIVGCDLQSSVYAVFVRVCACGCVHVCVSESRCIFVFCKYCNVLCVIMLIPNEMLGFLIWSIAMHSRGQAGVLGFGLVRWMLAPPLRTLNFNMVYQYDAGHMLGTKPS